MSDLNLSLYELESQLAQLIAMREEAADDLERQTIDEAIREYIRAEIRKVDRIIPLIRNWEALALARKAEASRLTESAKTVTQRIDRLKEMIKGVMQMMPWPDGKTRKLEGTTGTLLLKANGGKQAVTVTDPALVPDAMCWVTVRIRASSLGVLDLTHEERDGLVVVGIKEPSIVLIGEALARGEAVAGCRLEPRGEHVEIK